MSRSPYTTQCQLLDHEWSDSRVDQLVDRLIEDAENQAAVDAVAIELEQEDVLPEMVCGWGCSVAPLPKETLIKISEKRRRRKQNADINTDNMVVRCVKDDYNSDHHKVAWKANVEPGTYRYICNNGIYRSTKFASQGNDWVTAKRSKFFTERNTSTNPEVRQAQRSLKKDLDEHFNKHSTATLYRPDPPAATLRLTHSPTSHLPSTAPTANKNNNNTTNNSSSSSSNTANNKPTSTTQARASTGNDPQRNPPKLTKSVSDLFVENFSTRMTAIEKENAENTTPEFGLKHGAHPATVPSMAPNPHLRRDKDIGFSSQQNSSSHPNHNIPPDTARYLQKQSEDIAKDVFMVRPVIRSEQPLKPLEKLTPQQKIVERQGSPSDKISNATNSNRESPTLSASFITAMNAFNQIHHQPHR